MTRLAGALASALLILAALAPVSCAATPGALVPITVQARGTPEATDFVTVAGWTVSLDEAWVAIAAYRAYAEEDVLGALLRPGVARAHGGIDPDNGRRIRAEWLAPVVVDALGGDQRLGLVDAETGAIDEVAVTFADAPSSAGETRGEQAWVAGTATRDDETVSFAGGVTFPTSPRRVENIGIAGTIAPGAVLTLGSDPRVWLDEVAFELLPESADPSTPRPITADGQAHGALRLGLGTSRAWSAYLEANE
ncbi:MAG: hypothetical protein CMN30_24630 [Sandaracinus sp.]|nr:hypothetical protein [Sandaracinus sp.]|tara:strand:+ start:2304 stop:3056 length:753 start_codon:yes stop_codon:yes gene_type:complete